GLGCSGSTWGGSTGSTLGSVGAWGDACSSTAFTGSTLGLSASGAGCSLFFSGSTVGVASVLVGALFLTG
ncbi:hypothetical protein ACWWJI_18700, partial [Proteus mirabilis]